MADIINFQSAKSDSDAAALDILARTLWGEARGEGQAGMSAVANVVCNRVAYARAQRGHDYWWGNTLVRVCQKPFQFSCWNENDPNRAQLLRVDTDDPVFVLALRIARWAATGSLPDATGGATHYHALSVAPKWALGQTPTAVVGRHVFYRLVT